VRARNLTGSGPARRRARAVLQTEQVQALARSSSPDDRAAASVALMNSWKLEEGLEGAQMS
jgi:hypothetical protein